MHLTEEPIFGEVYTINICFKSKKISNFAAQN